MPIYPAPSHDATSSRSLAQVLDAYHAAFSGDADRFLSWWLRVPRSRLSELAKLPVPDAAAPTFPAEVAALAARVGCDAERLAELIRDIPGE